MTGVLLAVLATLHFIHGYRLGDRGFTEGMVLHFINAAVLIVVILHLLFGEGT